MRVDEFYDLTPRQFDNKHKGFEDNQTRLQEEDWQRARIISFFAVVPHVKKGTYKKPSDLFALPGEAQAKEKGKLKPMTKVEALKLAEKWK